MFFFIYAPITVISAVFSLSFIFQNFKGFIYLGFVLAAIIVREAILGWRQVIYKPNATNALCNVARYGRGSTGFSAYVISFTITYLCLPMFINHDVNWFLLWALLVFLFADITFKSVNNCYANPQDVGINLITGTALGLLISGLFYITNNSRFLFFNEISSTKEICSMPKKQQFKCTVYKNGEVVAST